MRRGELIVNLAMAFGPLVIGLLIAVALSLAPVRIPGVLVCRGLYGAGLSLLLTAKISLFRQGIWISVGPSQMRRRNRRLYRAAYVLLVTGALLNLLLLFSTIVPG